MKILFLVPPETISLESSVPKALEGGKGYYPDCPPENVSQEELSRRVRKIQPDIVAMSVMTFNLLDALHTARPLKQENPNLKVCLGGLHVNLYSKESLHQPEIDYVVFGEGENIFTSLIQALENNKPLKSINGPGYKANGEKNVNPAETELLYMNELLFPARHLVDVESYKHIIGEGRQFFTI